MTLAILYTLIIVSIKDFESRKSYSNSNAAGITGFDMTCSCVSVVSNVCMQYSCGATIQRASCFAGSSRITLEDGTIKALSDVQIGDKVLINKNNLYEPVLSFIHAQQEGYFSFLAITIKSLHVKFIFHCFYFC